MNDNDSPLRAARAAEAQARSRIGHAIALIAPAAVMGESAEERALASVAESIDRYREAVRAVARLEMAEEETNG